MYCVTVVEEDVAGKIGGCYVAVLSACEGQYQVALVAQRTLADLRQE